MALGISSTQSSIVSIYEDSNYLLTSNDHPKNGFSFTSMTTITKLGTLTSFLSISNSTC